MFVPRISALAGGLVLLAGGLTGGTAHAALDSTSSGMVAVSITAAHNVVMPTTIQPGVNQFRVTTEAKSSGFQLVQLATGYTLDAAIADIDAGLEKGKIPALKRFEANTTLLGGVNVAMGKVGKLTVSLPPGSYYAADIERNRPSAFTAFTVAGADTGATMPDGPTLRAVKSASWAKNPKSIPRKGTLTFENFSSQNHFVGLIKLKPGKTVEDFGAWTEAQMNGQNGPPPVNFGESFDGNVVGPGHTAAMNYRLSRGNYVLLCFWPDANMGGMPHAFMGMYRGITLK
ncbi:hypothetical protein [Nocardioides zhouii]|uniref:Spondin domain-containing protein n=1 Tax=Nocardioides zhouii TaxID=1168729 RepID=A0A4Q2T771_9ACTN|nr:hypothetical protein [Nocardioides zhouii]RYC12828.1 hypothetical protein EUA94_06205 [Nocardioides zhouii]